MEYNDALEIASGLLDKLSPFMERIRIAGSVRRKKPEVKDIELVVTPAIAGYDLFEKPIYYDLNPSAFGRPIKAGPRYKQIELPEGINLDLFIVLPPAQWGVIFALRTGPAELSKLLVTQRRYGGYLPSWAKVKDGGVYGQYGLILMPEEEDFLKFCGLEGVAPEYRGDYAKKAWQHGRA
jgi:DNA polymerase/3'-5' exonuclease PolX